MKIDRIQLYQIELPLVSPFQTSFGRETHRPCILVAVSADGITGWGECVAGSGPWYSSETMGTAWHIITDFLAPTLLAAEVSQPSDMPAIFKRVRGHQMAKAALENAVWDLFAQAEGIPLSQMIGGVRDRVEVGVSIGIQPTVAELLDTIEAFVGLGYGRIKVKIARDWHLDPLRAIRQRFPDIKLMADANSDFRLADAPLFHEMEPLNLLMIEQPLGYDDIIDHAKLQAQIKTPLCLDESIHGPDDARWAIELNACRIINMKVCRVGGLTHALQIHALCQAAGLGMWCGGMLETGVGRATNIHLATLPNFTLPGDISATSRYYHEDIALPDFDINIEDSTITVPTGSGIGVEVQMDRVAQAQVRAWDSAEES